MDLDQFCNQEAIYEERLLEGANDAWGNMLFEDPITIKVRKTIKQKLKKPTRHESYISVTKFLTTHPIKTGDRLDGEEVLAVESIVDFDGTILGYKAFPKPPVGFAN